MKKQEKPKLTVYDFSNFTVTDLFGAVYKFEDDVDVVKLVANKLYQVSNDINLMDKLKELFYSRKLSLSSEERDQIVSLLSNPGLQVNPLILMAVKELLTKQK